MKSIIFNNPKHSLIKYKIWYTNFKFEFFLFLPPPPQSDKQGNGLKVGNNEKKVFLSYNTEIDQENE